MGAVERVFLPWGAFAPDAGEFGHDNLTRLENVAPAYGNFLPLPGDKFGSGVQILSGFHVHWRGGAGYKQYAGGDTKLWEISGDGTTFTDRTRTAGGAYAAGFWSFWSFGDLVVACSYDNIVQSIVGGGANFANLITSTFKPQARYPFSIKGNLFLAHCNLPANYDTLTAGANPLLYCWSATDAPASFGSSNVDPQLVGAGFQQITNDMGQIRGGVGGDYGLVFQERGIVRIDGPPYASRTIADGYSTKYHYSITKVDQDIYFWGTGGPAVLRGGDGPAEFLAQGKVTRSLLDDFSGFSSTVMYDYGVPNSASNDISAAYVPRLSSIFFFGQRLVVAPQTETLVLVYNIKEDRFAFWRPSATSNTGSSLVRARPPTANFSSFRWTEDLVAIGDPSTTSGYTPTNLALFEFAQTKASLAHRFGRGFEQLDKDRVTRVLRARPVHRLSPDASALTLTVTVDDVNAPSGTPTTATAGPADSEGWHAFDSSLETAFHRPRVTYQFADDASPNLMECQGVELEFVYGAEYGT